MNDKGKYFHGKPVSKEEVLRELGDPATWASDERKIKFENHGLDKRINIKGLKGYLEYLKESEMAPLGSGTGLVSKEKNTHILEQQQQAVRDEIAKWTKVLEDLEKSPEAVEEYIAQLKWWLEFLEEHPDMDPGSELDEEMKELCRETNRKHREEKEFHKKEIGKYSKLLAKLKNSV